MDTGSLSAWRKEFARSAAWQREQDRILFQKERKRDQQHEASRSDDDLDALAQGLMLATDIEIAEFTRRLDSYDGAVVDALDDNTKRLDDVKRELEDMLAKAYVMPDGRRVFKTEDGLRVFDEHGVELSADEIDPDLIEDYRTKWEAFSARKDEEAKILEERQKLIEFQEKLDDARDELDDGEISKKELDELELEIDASMPMAVQRRMSGFEEQPESTWQETSAWLRPNKSLRLLH